VLYERYFPALYDFSVQLLADKTASAVAVEETFAQAMTRLRLGVRPERIKAWLFALARENSIVALRSVDHAAGVTPGVRSPNPGDAGWPLLLGDMPGPLDRSLLDLHLRRNLEADEIATALSLEPRTVRGRLVRLTEAFEQAAAARFLVRDGRSECSTVNDLLSEVRHDEARLSRRRLWRHAQTCGGCQAILRREGATPDAIVALPLAPQPAGLAGEVWQRLAERIDDRGTRSPRLLVPGVAAVVATTVVAIAVVPDLGKDRSSNALGSPAEPNPRLGAPAASAGAGSQGRVASLPPSEDATLPAKSPTADEAFRPPSQARTFSWPPAADAVAYAVTFYRDGDVVFAQRTLEPRLTLPPSWRYGGRVHTLREGTYRWVVWPILGADGRRASKAIVAASMVVD
jgi:DNA-directed RNA polymerase specialized sigma24 family protein